MKNSNKSTNISKLAFDITYESEGIEGFSIGENTHGYLRNLDKQTILGFLNSPDTKVNVVVGINGNTHIIAHNTMANESIKINGLGDHFLALVDVVAEASKKSQEKSSNPNTEIISHQFVKDVNKQLLSIRSEEVAIGKYRTVDFFGNPVEVHLTVPDENGRERPSKCAILESSKNNNIEKKMTELIDWTNNIAFKNGRDKLTDIAEFHTRFVQIHPFRDGNGRTARLLTNYLLLINDMPLVSIPTEQREEYIAYLDYAMAPDEITYRNEGPLFKEFHAKIYEEQGLRTEANRYRPLRNLLERNLINAEHNQIFSDILDYESSGKFHADQVSPDTDSLEK